MLIAALLQNESYSTCPHQTRCNLDKSACKHCIFSSLIGISLVESTCRRYDLILKWLDLDRFFDTAKLTTDPSGHFKSGSAIWPMGLISWYAPLSRNDFRSGSQEPRANSQEAIGLSTQLFDAVSSPNRARVIVIAQLWPDVHCTETIIAINWFKILEQHVDIAPCLKFTGSLCGF